VYVATATVHSLTKSERSLVAETERKRLIDLDEDGLLALLDRVRRARNKHVQLHRQEVGRQVSAKGARGMASTPPRRSASKAEIFEDALARVSSELGKRARASAAELRADRIAAARQTRNDVPVKSAGRAKPSTRQASPSRSRQPTPIERKKVSATASAGARRQAKTDAR
jgi:hypothetical protein